MKRLIALVVGLGVASVVGVCAEKNFDPYHGSRPLVVFIQSDPWAMVVGSDTPRVAIYENGDAIFQKTTNGYAIYRQTTLDKHELKSVRKMLRPLLSLKNLKPWYSARPNLTDQPITKIYVRNDSHEVATTVYGMMCSGTSLPAYTGVPGNSTDAVPPDELIKIHKWLCDFDYSSSKTWAPPYVEVMLWDYSYAPGASIHWPKEWPTLTSAQTFKHGDMYSVFLDGSLLSDLREFLSTRNAKGAVEISGRKMSASYRFVFPAEPVWRKAFRSATEQAAKE